MRNREVIAAKRADMERADALATVHLAVDAARKKGLPTRRIALTALLACGYRPTKNDAPIAANDQSV